MMMTMTEDPMADVLRRAERRGAARGLRRLQAVARRREALQRIVHHRHAPKAVAAAALIYLVLALTVNVWVGLIFTAVVLAGWSFARAALLHPAAATAAATMLLALGLVTVVLVWLPSATGGPVANPAAYLFVVAATVAPWLLRRHEGNRAVTAALGQAGCVVGAGVALVNPLAAG